MRHRQFDRQQDQLFSEIAVLLGVPRDVIGPDVSLRRGLGFDSLDTVKLIEALEENFGVRVPDDEIAIIETVADVERCMARLSRAIARAARAFTPAAHTLLGRSQRRGQGDDGAARR